MISALEFCRETGFPSALILTWSFDAVFFERVVLPALVAGGTRVPLVLADRRSLTAAQDRWPGQVQHLGRSYILEAIRMDGHFHPKMILRAGPQGGKVWISTGNVTPGGFGGNQELGVSWTIGPGMEDGGAWLISLLDDAATWCQGPTALGVIRQIRAIPWLASLDPVDPVEAGASAVLWSRPGATLAQQLAGRWSGRKFESLRLMTGSTDYNGEFLLWAHRTFGVRRALVAVDANLASFDKSCILDLPLDVRFVKPSATKPLHAKGYWFTGPHGEAAAFGSPNCSASAWVRPQDQGGNIELLMVYDHPSKELWAPVLDLFDAEPTPATDYLLETKAKTKSPPPQPDFSIQFISLDLAEGFARAAFLPALPDEAQVTLVIEDEEIRLKPCGVAGTSHWEGPLPECAWKGGVLFGVMVIRTAAAEYRTEPHWIDKLHDLREAARTHRVEHLLPRLPQVTSSKEQRQILNDLLAAMTAVLELPEEFPDLPPRVRPRNVSADGVPGDRLDPRAMGAPFLPGTWLRQPTESLDLPLSFRGVTRTFFKENGEESLLDTKEEATLGAEEDLAPPSGNPALEATPGERCPKRPTRARLLKGMEQFLAQLEGEPFANTCTATQMVQAVSLPIAVASLGEGSGWVEPAHAMEWTSRALAVLLHNQVTSSSSRGILAHLQERYEMEGRAETFQAVVGDGSLWITSAVALARLKWPGVDGALRRALLVRDLLGNPCLEANVDPARLLHLAARLRHPEVVTAVREEFPSILKGIISLEAWLGESFDRLLEEQEKGIGRHEKGDPLFRRGHGWCVVQEARPIRRNVNVPVQLPDAWGRPSDHAPKVKSTGFFVNLRLAFNEHRGELPELPFFSKSDGH